MSWTPAPGKRTTSVAQVYQGFYELNPSGCSHSLSCNSSISGILWVEPQLMVAEVVLNCKYIRDFMSWTPAAVLRRPQHLQVYQGFYELNPSLLNMARKSMTSISGILWVEPQLSKSMLMPAAKYIRDFMSWTPASPTTMIVTLQVYQGFYELNPSGRSFSCIHHTSISGILWVEPQL